jgi:hypothetical protein
MGIRLLLWCLHLHYLFSGSIAAALAGGHLILIPYPPRVVN